jgi:acetyltransferase
MRPLLDGERGGESVDIEALIEVITRFSELAIDVVGVIDAIDVNPLIAGPRGVVAVDALMRSR